MSPELLDACRQLGGPARPTYCNVPTWAQWLVYLGGFLAVAVFAYGAWRHVQAWRRGGGTVSARHLDHVGQRARLFVRNVLAQRATLARRYPGAFHFAIFWGFVLLLIGTVLATIDWDVAHLVFGEQFLVGGVYLAYEFVLDCAGAALIVGLLLAIWRRYIVSPHHVIGTWDFVIWSLLFVNVSGFVVEGLRLAMVPVAWGGASWLGQGIANLVYLAPAGFVTDVAPTLHLWTWLAHLGVALAFVAAIPYTNAVHMVTTATNAVLRSVDPILPGAALQRVDLENAETFGVSRMSEFSWKQRLGVDACTRCGRCETVCPAYMSGTSLNPKGVIVSLSRRLRDDADSPPRVDAEGADGAEPHGQAIVGEGLLVAPDTLWACTTCLACVEACPAFIEIVDDLVDMRRYLTLSEGSLPGTAPVTLRNMGTSGNPWGYSPEDRLAWAEGLDVPRAEAGRPFDVLYWVGCSASYDVRNQRIARSTVRLLRAAGVDFAVMAEERCLCDSARRLGEEYLFQTAAEENIANLSSLTFDRIVCHCPHCFNTLKNEYPQFGGHYRVVHHSQLLAELVTERRIPIEQADRRRLAYHDSCYLGRYNGEYAAPRTIMRAAGSDVVELPRRGADGLCCGGGGGRMWFDHPEQSKAVEIIRLEEALAANVEGIGVACPFCMTMLSSALGSTGTEGIELLDVAEILARCLPDQQ